MRYTDESGTKALLLGLSLSLMLACPLALAPHGLAAPEKGATKAQPDKTEKSDKTDKSDKDKTDKNENKESKDAKAADKDKKEAAAAPKPEPVIENVTNVTTTQLVDKPADFMNKNVKFTAHFYMFANLALDYKPALRSSKTHLSFLILRPDSHIPFSELKLAMPIPKEKDPDNQMLTSLKDGDEVEVTGKVFATALDEPWVDVLRLKKLKAAPDPEKDKAAAGSSEKKEPEKK